MLKKNGALIIDEYGETSIKDIYAAGDCASVYHLIKGEMYIYLLQLQQIN